MTKIAKSTLWYERDAFAAKRAFDAMMTMKKTDVAATEAAVRG